ncbi:MAG: alpha/beta hydrolase, partial [Chitinophagales bacterium]|nr:alpha/beta hydrolase [Chitinophagales bacterium]
MARSAGHPIIGVTYRKAPEDPFPAALEDAKTVYQQLLDDGYKNIIVSGDSAGGGLSLALTMELIREKKPLPHALVLLSPWTDLTSSGDSVKRKAAVDPLIGPELLEVFAEKYAAGQALDNPLISPLFGDFHNFPPTLIQVGTDEVLLDDSVRLAKKMKDRGVSVELEIWENMMHVFQWLAGLTPEANNAIKDIGEFVNKQEVLSTNKESLHKEIY